jgi:hypothetical protein
MFGAIKKEKIKKKETSGASQPQEEENQSWLFHQAKAKASKGFVPVW